MKSIFRFAFAVVVAAVYSCQPAARAQPLGPREATAAEAAAGVSSTTFISPRRMVSGPSGSSAITDDTTTNATVYPIWVTAATGNLPLKVSSTKIFFNPSTGQWTDTGSILLGATGTAATTLHVVDTGTATPRGITHDQYNTGTNSAQFNTRKARGTFATPLTIVSGDILGRHLFWGHDGSSFIESANIRATSTGTIAATRVPSQLEFYTSTDATPSVLTKGFTLGSDQSAAFVGNVIGSGALNAFNVAAGVTPFAELEVDSTSTSSPRGIMSAQFNTGTDGARMHFRKARGTRASPTTVVTGDNLGRLVGTGYDGSSYLEMASIYFATEGTVAATRIPTNIQFWTATNAAPSVLTLAGQFNSSQQLLLVNGTAAAPAYSFTSATGDGLYLNSAVTHDFGLALNGTRAFLIQNNSGDPILNGPTGAGSITFPAAGGLTFTANGSNKSITLTPSGTGKTIFGPSSVSTPVWVGAVSDLTTFGALSFNGDISNSGISGIIGGGGAGGLYISVPAAANLTFRVGTTAKVLMASTGNLLLGGLTTDGTGVLQFPASVAASGGITLGTDINIYRQAASRLSIKDAAGDGPVFFLEGNSAGLLSQWSASTTATTINARASGASMVLQTNGGITALTLDSSQNAAFAGNAVVANGAKFGWTSGTGLAKTADGVIKVVNDAGTGFSTISYGTLGGATSVAQLQKSVTSIANNTATDVLTVTIPNAAHSARLHVELAGSLGAGGAIGANEATGVISYDFAIARTAGVATVVGTSTAYGSSTAAVAGAATITVTAAATGMTGATSATQTFTIQVTIARGSGSSTNHTAQVRAEILNANAAGITLS